MRNQDGVAQLPQGEIFPLETSEIGRAYVFARDDGMNFRLSERANLVLTLQNDGLSFDEISRRLTADSSISATPQQVATFHQELISRLSVQNNAAKAPRLSVKFNILPARRVQAVANVLAGFFRPTPLLSGILFILATTAVWISVSPLNEQPVYTSDSLVCGYAIFLVSLLIHEFGHASAAARFGKRTGPIGFMLYLAFPALFSDVSSTWTLTRPQRILVSLAGSYFQILMSCPLLLYGALHQSATIDAFLYMLIGSTVFNLNPFFKFDGYWLLADALGVTNLSEAWRRALISLRMRSKMPWPTHTTAAVTIYAISSAVVWIYFLYVVGRMLWARLDQVRTFALDIASHRARLNGWYGVELILAVGAASLTGMFVFRRLHSLPNLVASLRRHEQ